MNARTLLARSTQHVALLVWLTLVWILLWGTWSWANVLSGLGLAVAVTLLLPLPPILGGLQFHPVGLVVYLARFCYDLVLSSVQVALLVFRPGDVRGAIIAVPVRTDSDLLLTILSETLCLIPGSIVIDLDRENLVIALHLPHVTTEAEVRRQKARVLEEEELVVRAFGSPRDLANLRKPPPAAPVPADRTGAAS